ncbi:MAG: tetratricopeptide repeat protein [Pontibacterium sp.]
MKNRANLLLMAGVLVLTGCVGGNQRPVVVEDRTRTTRIIPPAGTVVDAPASADVKVVPVDDLPVQREKKTDTATSGGWVSVRESERQHRPNPAVVALLGNAEQQITRGSYSAAGSTLERAQRIAPREPEVYYQLSVLRLREGKWPQAEQLALKGAQVAAGSAPMLKKLWLLIADVRDEAGDRIGAQRARLKARRY